MSETYTDASGRVRTRKTHCKYGHEFPADARLATNWRGYSCRVCNECQKIRMQRKRANPDFRANESARTAEWRAKQGSEYLAGIRESRRKKKEWLDALKVKCARCPETHVSCLEFHHRNPAEKDFLLSVGVAKFSLEKLQAEVEKCDVICANCHRKLHYEERHAA